MPRPWDTELHKASFVTAKTKFKKLLKKVVDKRDKL